MRRVKYTSYTSKHKSKTRIFSPAKSNQSDVLIFVEDVEDSPDLKSARSNAPKVPSLKKNNLHKKAKVASARLNQDLDEDDPCQQYSQPSDKNEKLRIRKNEAN
jgi:hypothetical protein